MRAALVLLLLAATAHAGGRYCERRSALCWDCADIQFPAAIPCSNPSLCAPTELCVDQSSVPTCFPPLTYCCPSAPCERPPECEGPGLSCSDLEPDGQFDTCTFLSDCPPPPDAGPPDATPPDAPAPDATLPDAAAPDAALADAAPPPVDSGAADATPTPPDASRDAGGGGGCDCHVAHRRPPLPGAALLAALTLAAARRPRRRASRSSRRA